MKFSIITLFPQFFDAFASVGVIGGNWQRYR